MTDTPYSNKDLEKLLCNHLGARKLQIYTRNDFRKGIQIKKMFKDNNFIIVFLDNPTTGIGHWNTIIQIDENVYELFDSLGKESGYDKSPIYECFKRARFKLIENEIGIQDIASNVCGKHCILRINARHLPFHEFIKIYDNNSLTPDKLAMSLVALEL